MRPSAKSLVLDLLSTLSGRSLAVRALVAAGRLFDLEESSIRVALARLRAAGRVEQGERGYYRLAEAAQAVQDQVITWRRLESRVRPWDGTWWAAASGGREKGRSRGSRDGQRALRFLGFRSFEPGLEIRPASLAGGLDGARARLAQLGLEPRVPVFALAELDPAADERARHLWDGERIIAGYRASRAELRRSRARLADLPLPEAMAESFRLGGRVIRELALDPLLPEPIVPATERAALVAAMIEYDRLGRAAWQPFLREHGVAARRAPLDLRLDASPIAMA